jgi:hypothetical protein
MSVLKQHRYIAYNRSVKIFPKFEERITGSCSYRHVNISKNIRRQVNTNADNVIIQEDFLSAINSRTSCVIHSYAESARLFVSVSEVVRKQGNS